jgi:hypothetical protein
MAEKETPKAEEKVAKTPMEKAAQEQHDEAMKNAEANQRLMDEINQRAQRARFRPVKSGETF